MIGSRMEASALMDLAKVAFGVWRGHTRRCSLALALPTAVLFLVSTAAWVHRAEAQSHGTDGPQRSDASASPAKPAATPASEPDVARLRSETIDRLKTIAPGAGTNAAASNGATAAGSAQTPASGSVTRKGDAAANASGAAPPAAVSPANKLLADMLKERLRSLDEYDKIAAELASVTNPEPNPVSQAEEAKSELRQLQKTLAEATTSPEILLPPCFRGAAAKVTSAVSTEMKDALESNAEELKEWKTRLDSTKSEAAKAATLQTTRRLDRDKLFQTVANLKARSDEYEGAVTDAQSTAARRLAEERLVNYKWETKVESLRLRLLEAQIALETKLANLRKLNMHIAYTHVLINQKTQELIQAKYKVAAETYERDLNSAAANEESKARRTDRPARTVPRLAHGGAPGARSRRS